jgi:outer membrane protein
MFLKRLILILVLFVGTSAFAQVRIATVDLGRVFTNYWKTKQAKAFIDQQRSEIEKNEKELITNFTRAKEEYQKLQDSVNDPAVSTEERDKRKRDAESKLRDLKDQDDNIAQFERGSQTRLSESIKRTHDNIISDIRVVVNAKAKTDGYTMVIDTAAQSVSDAPVVLYSAPGTNDITEAVTKQLNVGAPVETPASDDVAKDKDKGGGK